MSQIIVSKNDNNILEFIPSKRDYSEYKLFDVKGNEIDKNIEIDYLEYKLLTGDHIVVQEDGTIQAIYDSKYRNTTKICGILVLNGQTYGRVKRKLIYKCIPNDKSLPMILIPYEEKSLGFNKSKVNKFVLFKLNKWNGKHPEGTLTHTLGDVNDFNVYCEYELFCKNVSNPIQKFIRKTSNTIKTKTKEHEDIHEDILSKYKTILNRCEERIITIDPENCKDYDDAISILNFDDSNGDNKISADISVYISNVPLWMDYLELWDKYANRISTIYLPDRERTMIPPILSHGLCSLQQGQRRYAISMDIHLINGEINRINYNLTQIKVYKNYNYEDDELLESDDYNNLFKTTKLLNNKLGIYNKITDSHDVVAFYMMLMNSKVGEELYNRKLGIFRSLKLDNKKKISNLELPEDVNRFLNVWKSSGGKYTNYLEYEGHDMMSKNIKAYAQVTSPIRRIIDLINMTCLCNEFEMIKLSKNSKIFVSKWMDKLDMINTDMKNIRRVENNIKLLKSCLDGEYDNMNYDGYIIDITRDNEGERKYGGIRYINNVFIPKINVLSQFKSSEKLEELINYKFSIHLFNDEGNMKRKVRINKI